MHTERTAGWEESSFYKEKNVTPKKKVTPAHIHQNQSASLCKNSCLRYCKKYFQMLLILFFYKVEVGRMKEVVNVQLLTVNLLKCVFVG